MTKLSLEVLTQVETALGHSFADPSLPARALTHNSALSSQLPAATRREQGNERLEFLGDAVLGGTIGRLLYSRFPELDEGDLTDMKSQLLCREMQASLFTSLGLLPAARLSLSAPPDESVRSNLLEALLGAVFLDGGWPALCDVVERLYTPHLTNLKPTREPKGAVQAWCQARRLALPRYFSWPDSDFPEHDRRFYCELLVPTLDGGDVYTMGYGRTVKEAEKDAARQALQQLDGLE